MFAAEPVALARHDEDERSDRPLNFDVRNAKTRYAKSIR